ncbi:Phosphatases II [Mycena sanguinolenta]|uniref:protein-tyrosine-phosphatase n=1 Tax=Mycena sanguinolenta TaxID=230812 RepID=A0A8H6TWT5_9AGAR|nr:Phosphatases II [Mycena sanguinolenta]
MFSRSYSPSADEVLKDQIYLGNIWAAKSEGDQASMQNNPYSVCMSRVALNRAQTPRYFGGRVLIHCVMGVSRSTTVLAAYLMKTRSLCPAAALSFIKQHRPRVQPNYGFLKQLNTFLECGYLPTATHPAYISWKKKHKRDVTQFLNHIIDCVAIIPDALMLCSEFPSEPDQAELLLLELGVTHFLSLAPAEMRRTNCWLPFPMSAISSGNAVAGGGKVLVYSLLEVRACTVVGAYLMSSRNISPEAATNIVKDALPLFDPTLNFTRALSLFAACRYKPTRDHPALATHRVGDGLKKTPRAADEGPGSKRQSMPGRNAELLTRTAAAIMSETGIDMSAFGDALAAIQQKASVPHSAAVVA